MKIPLLKNGLIDSLGILEVVTFLEREFGIVVSDEELLPENFESIGSLSKFVREKTRGADTAQGSAQDAIESK